MVKIIVVFWSIVKMNLVVVGERLRRDYVGKE